jgi:hypothetical protein
MSETRKINKSGTVECAFNPSHSGGRGRRIQVLGHLRNIASSHTPFKNIK